MKKTALVTITVILFGCSHQKVDTKAEGEKVMQLSRDWTEAAVARDVEKAVSYWAEDAIFMSANQAPLRGKQAIREMVEGSFKTPGFGISWKPQTVQVSESGDMAYLIEESVVQYTDSTGKAITQNNNAVTIWRKQGDGSWKNVVDVSVPAGPPSK